LKFNNKNILHYIYFAYLSGILLIAVIIKVLFRIKNNNSLTMTGHYFNDNIQVLYQTLSKDKLWNPRYATFKLRQYLHLRKTVSVLYIGNPIHMFKALNCDILLVGMGLHLHKWLKIFFLFKSIYINHGIFTGENYSKSSQIKYSEYNEIWHFSEFEKSEFDKNILNKTTKAVVTGFPLTYYYKKEVKAKPIKQLKNCLVAFSNTNTENYHDKIFSINNLQFLHKLEDLSIKNKILFTIKPHPSSKISTNSKKFILNSKYINLYNDNSFDSLDSNFFSSSMLLTDISSFYVHYLLANKPILFLSPENNILENANKVLKNEFIDRIETYEGLEEKIKTAVKSNFLFTDSLYKLKAMIYKDLDVDKILDNCNARLIANK